MSAPLKVVDGLKLSEAHRAVLRPGEMLDGRSLPRYFYEIESWEQAKATHLTAHFALSELMIVDHRECDLLLREFPHYVPCAVSILARYLEELRQRVDAPIHIAANGGYRSPAHAIEPGIHAWATAADICRIGTTWIDTPGDIEKYGAVAAGIGQEVWVAPPDTDDHLHIDLRHLLWEPAP